MTYDVWTDESGMWMRADKENQELRAEIERLRKQGAAAGEIIDTYEAEIEKLKRKVEEEYRRGHADGWHQSFKKSQAARTSMLDDGPLFKQLVDAAAENERLRTALVDECQAHKVCVEMRDIALAEVKRLRKAIETCSGSCGSALEPKP